MNGQLHKPNYAEAYNNLGAVFQELNQFDKAIEQYKAGLFFKNTFLRAQLIQLFLQAIPNQLLRSDIGVKMEIHLHNKV